MSERDELDEVTAAEFEEAMAGVSDESADGQSLEQLLAEAQAEAIRNMEGWQRAQAEFANARKRMDRQRVMVYTDANADLVSKLLPVIDDMELALESAPESVQEDGWFSGMELVNRKFGSILENLNVASIEAVGQMFDPMIHEAVGQEPSEEYESGIVTRELRKGYQLGDRVIRPSMVMVAG